MNQILHLVLTGSPRDIGHGHGESLRSQIAGAIEVYSALFANAGFEQDDVLSRAAHFSQLIRSFNPAYGEEIDAIAQAANQDPLWIYALNARSELMSSKVAEAGECTALFFKQSAVLAQTWDWVEALEPLVALVSIEQAQKPRILMMTEPGLIGKIGMNDRGLGLCFNFLSIDKPTDGLPLHITNRAVLECSAPEQARSAIKSAGVGKSGNLLVGHHSGEGFDVEFAGDKLLEPTTQDSVITHTNHFLDEHYLSTNAWLAENSKIRQHRAVELCRGQSCPDVEAAKSVLSDRANGANAILRAYQDIPELGVTGTVCTIVQDLPAGQFHFRLGNKPENEFQTFDLPRVAH